MSDYQPKQGDRVKLTLEGVVQYDIEEDVWFIKTQDPDVVAYVRHGQLEKLPDPEPEWKRGTLVRLPIFSISPLIFSGNAWHLPGGTPTGGEHVSDAWKNGTLKILWQPEGD